MKILGTFGLSAVFGGVSASYLPLPPFGTNLTGGFTSKCNSHWIRPQLPQVYLVSECEDGQLKRHQAKLDLNK